MLAAEPTRDRLPYAQRPDNQFAFLLLQASTRSLDIKQNRGDIQILYHVLLVSISPIVREQTKSKLVKKKFG